MVLSDATGEGNAARVSAHEHDSVGAAVSLDDFVGDAGQGPPHVVGVQQPPFRGAVDYPANEKPPNETWEAESESIGTEGIAIANSFPPRGAGLKDRADYTRQRADSETMGCNDLS